MFLAGILLLMMMTGSAFGDGSSETGFLDRTVEVGGERYRYQVFVPPDYTPDRSWPVVLFLHGSGERGDDGILPTEIGLGTAIRRGRSRFPFVALFPQCRPGARWFGSMEKVALAALDRTLAEFHGDPDRVCLAGISMGGAGVWYLGARYPERWASLVPVCGRISLPGGVELPEEVRDLRGFDSSADSLAGRIAGIPIWTFHGEADDVISVEETRSMVAALERAGAEVRYTEYPGVGHGAWDPAFAEPELFDWIASKNRVR